jgi:hypothetical protein
MYGILGSTVKLPLFFKSALSIETVDSDDGMNNDELERNSHGLIKVLPWLLPRGTEENHSELNWDIQCSS